MATEIMNQATVNYTYSGSTETKTETSNIATVNLLADSALSINKYTQDNSFTPGGTVKYYIDIENVGTQYFTGVRINDDLGGTPRYLTYVPNSAMLYINDQLIAAQVASTNPLVFTLSPLAAGKKMILSYSCTVSTSIPTNVSTITNNIEGIGYAYSGEAKDYSSTEIVRSSSADITITKSASATTVSRGQIFNYVITLNNSGVLPATVSSVTDQLPTNFVINTVQLKVGSGATTTLSSSDYTLSSANLFTLPSSTGPSINVPAATTSGTGKTVITISGYLNG